MKRQRTTTTTTTTTASYLDRQGGVHIDMATDEFIDEMLRDINWGTEGDLPGIQKEERKDVGVRKGRISSTGNGPSPSTPRTFTRNPAPPTPSNEVC